MNLRIAGTSLARAAVMAAAVLQTWAAPAGAASGLSPELQVQRVMLERTLEDRVKAALTEVLGTTAVVPVVNVGLTVEELQAPKAGRKAGVEYVLPGVPLDQQLTKKGREVTDIRRADRLVTATVFVGAALDEQKSARAKEIAAQILQINTAAGDSLELRSFEPPAAPPAQAAQQRSSRLGLAATIVFGAFAVGLLGFLYAFVRPFLRALLEQLAKARHASEESGGGAGMVFAGGPAAAAASEAGAKLSQDEDALFGFINEDNLVGLVQALGRENEMLITSVLECLPRPLAAKAFALFPAEKRRDIVLHSRSVKYGNPESIRNIEKQIRSKLGFSFGGVRKMCRIIQRAGTNVRAAVIADIAKVDPDLAKHLRDNLIEFEDVLQLEDRAFARVARELSIPALARYLKAGPPEWIDRVCAKLNPELAELLREQVSFSGQAASDQVEEEFVRIVEIVERLRAAGLIAAKNAQPSAS